MPEGKDMEVATSAVRGRQPLHPGRNLPEGRSRERCEEEGNG